MIEHLTEAAKRKPDVLFFCVQRDTYSVEYSFRRANIAVAALARELERHGMKAGGTFACNMYNGAELVLLSLAAAYGGYTLALLNPRLSAEERQIRLVELENATGECGMDVLTNETVNRLLIDATGFDAASFSTLPNDASVLTRLQVELETFAQNKLEAFDANASGLVIFTSGSSGTPKAAFLPWNCLMSSAAAANDVLALEGKGVWQMVLPMCHVGGFQILVRSLLNMSAFIVYERYQPKRILNDILSFRVTHISVVDKILADLLDHDHDKVITQYSCILLGGAELNKKTIKAALRAKAKVYASYGMTETASLIAAAPVTRNFDGGLEILPGYDVRIMRPDEDGIGQLHVAGPGIFEGYLNARKASSADGYFVTGDRASVDRYGLLRVYARTEDLIISGGENIYPAEIRDVLLSIPGVKDAYVFGTADETWGYRPVAFVEADYSAETIARDCESLGLTEEEIGIYAASCPQEFAHMIHAYLDDHMSKLHHPKHILVLDEFPLTVAGKVDRQALKQRYDKRIDIKQITLYRIKQPFVHPVKTPKTTITDRESFFVEVEDWAGRIGIGECVSFKTNWYLPETIEEDFRIVRDSIAPIVLGERYLHPSQVSKSFATFPELAKYPMAKAAVEPAVWDLYGKIVGKPLSKLIGGSNQEKILGGVVIGLGTPDEVCDQVDKAVEAGYTRVKLKVNPETVLGCVVAVREKHPDVIIMLDANQSFDETNLDTLCKLDEYNIACIEEPYNPKYVPRSGDTNLFARLSELQEHIKTPVCLDESVVTAQDMEEAMDFDNLKCYALKVAKFGGIQPTLDFYHWLRDQGKLPWMGGMFDTGVSKRMHAAFATLPGMDLPADVSDYSEYFQHDTTIPPLVLSNGELVLNNPDHPAGLGCVLDKIYLQSVLVDEITIAKE